MTANNAKVMPTTERIAAVLSQAPTLRSAVYRLGVSEKWLREVAAERPECVAPFAACKARGVRKSVRAGKAGVWAGGATLMTPRGQ